MHHGAWLRCLQCVKAHRLLTVSGRTGGEVTKPGEVEFGPKGLREFQWIIVVFLGLCIIWGYSHGVMGNFGELQSIMNHLGEL